MNIELIDIVALGVACLMSGIGIGIAICSWAELKKGGDDEVSDV